MIVKNQLQITTLAASSGKRNVTVVGPSFYLSLSRILNVTNQWAVRDVASVHFTRTDILVEKKAALLTKRF